jgi:hypothetical protein
MQRDTRKTATHCLENFGLLAMEIMALETIRADFYGSIKIGHGLFMLPSLCRNKTRCEKIASLTLPGL